jgi:hypothetical protein
MVVALFSLQHENKWLITGLSSIELLTMEQAKWHKNKHANILFKSFRFHSWLLIVIKDWIENEKIH